MQRITNCNEYFANCLSNEKLATVQMASRCMMAANHQDRLQCAPRVSHKFMSRSAIHLTNGCFSISRAGFIVSVLRYVCAPVSTGFVCSPNSLAVDLMPTLSSSRLSICAYIVSYIRVQHTVDRYSGNVAARLTVPVVADHPMKVPQLMVSPRNS
jgi:hypothetical protein